MDELTGRLITAMHSETMRVTEICAKDREETAFIAGYVRGLHEGSLERLREIQESLGIPCEYRETLRTQEALSQWRKQEKEER